MNKNFYCISLFLTSFTILGMQEEQQGNRSSRVENMSTKEVASVNMGHQYKPGEQVIVERDSGWHFGTIEQDLGNGKYRVAFHNGHEDVAVNKIGKMEQEKSAKKESPGEMSTMSADEHKSTIANSLRNVDFKIEEAKTVKELEKEHQYVADLSHEFAENINKDTQLSNHVADLFRKIDEKIVKLGGKPMAKSEQKIHKTEKMVPAEKAMPKEEVKMEEKAPVMEEAMPSKKEKKGKAQKRKKMKSKKMMNYDY